MAEQDATPGTAPDAASARNTAHYADQSVMTGAGGEVHQTAGGDTPGLTTQRGTPVADDQNSLKIGARGPTALEGFFRFPRIQWQISNILIFLALFDGKLRGRG